MACNKPFMRLIRSYQNRNGYDVAVPTPCGHCAGCLKDYIQAWSDRCTFRINDSKASFGSCNFDV